MLVQALALTGALLSGSVASARSVGFVPSIFLLALAGAPSSARAQALECRPAPQVTRCEANGSLSELQQRREHTFEAAAGQRVEVWVSSGDFDTVLELTSPAGDTLRNDDYGRGTDSHLSTVSWEGGLWRAVITSFMETGEGRYRVTASLGETMAVRELEGGTLGSPADSMSAKGHRYQVRTFELSHPSWIRAEMIGGHDRFSPLLVLTDPEGQRFSSLEDWGSMESASVEVPVATSGTWTLFATHHLGSDSLGAYRLRLLEAETVQVNHPAEIVDGVLVETDRRLIQGEYYHLHWVEASAEERLVIELASTDFDAFLAVRSPDGRLWCTNDDGGDGSNSRVELPAQAGVWSVYATTFGSGATGTYRMSVLRMEAQSVETTSQCAERN